VRANSLYALAVRRGIFNMDEYRHAIERMERAHYLSASYYERSLTSLATLLGRERNREPEELERARGGPFSAAAPSAPGRTNVPPASASSRAIGSASSGLRARPCGLPAYIRGQVGRRGEASRRPILSRCARTGGGPDEPT
jgi:nitrile hydratase